MKTLAAIPILLFSATLFGQTITDSSVNCPLVVTGVPSNLTGKNTGGKDIIAYSMEFVAVMPPNDETPPNRLHFTHDYYFQPNSIKAGSAIMLHALPSDAIGPKESFTVVTKYLQFADGTEWGDASDWPDRLEVRKGILSLMQNAATAYQAGGNDGLQKFLISVRNDDTQHGQVQILASHLMRLGMTDALSELQMRVMMAKAHAAVTK